MLATVIAISAFPYVTSLSFYSDDWYILSTFQADVAQHRFGLGSAMRGFEARPVQGLYLAGLYAVFGLHPLGYHLVNLVVITASVLLFHSLLVRLGFERAIALATSLVFLALPQLSTVRVWVSASQIPLSMLAALVALHCQSSFVQTGRRRWLIAGAAFAAISVAAYEIFAPIIAAMALWLWLSGPRAPRRNLTVSAGPLAAVAIVMAWKLFISERVPSGGLALYAKGLRQFTRPDIDWRVDNGLNMFAAASVHFWWPIRGAASAFAALLTGELGLVALVASLAAALISFVAMRSVPSSDQRESQRLLLLGIAVFALGHAVFLVTPAMFFSPGGPSNRVLVAAALGVAMIIAAVVRATSDILAARVRATIFAAMISTLVFFGMLRVQQIEKHWVNAGVAEAMVMRRAASDLYAVPESAVVILNNVCPYDGPAIVMEAPWDISGALSVATGRPIRGDAVSARMSLKENGVSTSIYGEPAFYPYGPMLYSYDPMKRVITPLPDRDAVAAFLAATRKPCPESFPGHGVLI